MGLILNALSLKALRFLRHKHNSRSLTSTSRGRDVDLLRRLRDSIDKINSQDNSGPKDDLVSRNNPCAVLPAKPTLHTSVTNVYISNFSAQCGPTYTMVGHTTFKQAPSPLGGQEQSSLVQEENEPVRDIVINYDSGSRSPKSKPNSPTSPSSADEHSNNNESALKEGSSQPISLVDINSKKANTYLKEGISITIEDEEGTKSTFSKGSQDEIQDIAEGLLNLNGIEGLTQQEDSSSSEDKENESEWPRKKKNESSPSPRSPSHGISNDLVNPEVGRSDWDYLDQIESVKFEQAVSVALPGGHLLNDEDFNHHHTVARGSYHHVEIVEVLKEGPLRGRYVVKIPSHGSPNRWQSWDAEALRREARLMLYIRKHTNCPIPQVLDYRADMYEEDNFLGAPYIVMTAAKADAVSGWEVWYDNDGTINQPPPFCYIPSASTESKRSRLLKSLAQAMAELQHLKFDKTGFPCFADDRVEHPTMEPGWRNKDGEAMAMEGLTTGDFSTKSKCVVEEPTYCSSQEYFVSKFQKMFPRDPDSSGKARMNNGLRAVMQWMISGKPFNDSRLNGDANESFVLRHNDLNLQNVLCDPGTGEVVAIIDWDSCLAVPRCYGFSSLPLWLIYDWFLNYDPAYLNHTAMQLNTYRQKYAQEFCRATGLDGDGKYTYKSAMYQALLGAMLGHQFETSKWDIVLKILSRIPEIESYPISGEELLSLFAESANPKFVELIGGSIDKTVAPLPVTRIMQFSPDFDRPVASRLWNSIAWLFS